MNKATVKAIRNHAAACYPRESCGLVVMVGRSEKYWPCQNVAGDDDHFVISPADYAAAEDAGMVVGVVHSHPDETDVPSKADRIMCDESGQPWYIVAVSADGAAETILKIEPTGMQPPLIGRDFLFGVRDCYTLIRDFYQRVMHIELPDFERTDGFWERGEDLYMDNFAKAGFYRLQDSEPLQFGDVLLIQMRSTVAIQVNAEQFGSVPTVAVECYGRIIAVPSNYNPDTRQYVGVWDGTFKQAYSNNPAWVFYDLVINLQHWHECHLSADPDCSTPSPTHQATRELPALPPPPGIYADQQRRARVPPASSPAQQSAPVWIHIS